MSRLDRYVGRIVLGAFGAALLFFLLLAILIDLLNNWPRYINRADKDGLSGVELALYVAWYYCRLVPVLFTVLTPFVTVIACMFSVARLQQANEMVPMLFVGRSMQRVLRPMLWCGLLAGLAMAGCWHWLVPHVGASIAADEAFLKQGSAVQKNLVQDTHGEVSQYLYVGEFDPHTGVLREVGMLIEGDLAEDATIVTAKGAAWDQAKGDWRLSAGRWDRTHESGPQEWLQRPDLTPAILLQRSRDTIDPETLSYTDLLELTVSRPNRADVKLALHRHITYPLANLLLLLLALPLAVYYERGGRITRVLMAIGLCGAYMMFDLTCLSLGQRGLVHPIVAAWSPTILFGAFGIVLFGSIKT